MKNIVGRMQDYLTYKDIKPAQAETAIGVSNGTLSKPFKNGTTIKTDTLEKFLKIYTDINKEWLLTGDSSMIREMENNTPASVFKLRTDRIQEEQDIPLYNLEASAGLVELFQNQGDQTPIDTIHIPNLPKCDGAVFVTGDSMYPLLKSGDIIAYKQIHDIGNEIFWGEMYLVSVEVSGEEYISVKYIQKSDKGDDYIKLVSQNEHHQPKDILLKKVRALALVKASIRINSMR